MIDNLAKLISVVLATLLISLGFYARGLHSENVRLSTEVSEKTAKIAVLNSENQVGTSIATEFSNRFKELEEKEIARQRKVEEALASIQSLTSRSVSLSNKILASTPSSEDLCFEANVLINMYLEELKALK